MHEGQATNETNGLEQGNPSVVLPALVWDRAQKLGRIWNSQKDRTRREDAAKLLRIDAGDAQWLIRKMPDEPQEHFDAKAKWSPRLVPLALDQLGYLYSGGGPTRTTGEETGDELWKRWLWDYGAGVDVAMGEVDRLMRLLGHVEVLPLFEPAPDVASRLDRLLAGEPTESSAAEAGISLVVMTPDMACVLPNAFDPHVAEAVLVRMNTIGIESEGKITERFLFHYWDDTHFAMFLGDDAGNLQPAASPGEGGATAFVHEHRYGELPLAACREEEVKGEYWGRPWQGKDLLVNLRCIYELGTEYAGTAMLQRGQPVHHKKGNTRLTGWLAPYSLIEVPDGDSFTIIGNAANLDGMRDALVTELELLSKTMGLPSRSFRLDDRAARSGVSIHLDRAELSDDRRKRIPKAQRLERAIARKTRAVVRRHAGVELPPVTGVDYGSWGDGESHEQRKTRVESEVDRRLASRVDAVLELHPGMTREQAAERIAAAGITEQAVNVIKGLVVSVRAGELPAIVAQALARMYAPELVDQQLDELFEGLEAQAGGPDQVPVVAGPDPALLELACKLFDRTVPMKTLSQWLGLGIPEYPGWDVSYVSGSMVPADVGLHETLSDDIDKPVTEPAEAPANAEA